MNIFRFTKMPRLRKVFARAVRASVVIGVAAPLLALLAVAPSYAQAPALPAVQLTAKSPNFKDGKVLLEERRIRAYTYLGADENTIRETLQRIVRQEGDEPGGWDYEWSQLGKYYEDRDDMSLKSGLRRPALDAYMTSSVYYALAWFPNVASQQEAKAYDAQLNVYQKGGKLFDVPLEVVKVPYKDGMITTYLHKPAGVAKPPLVIWCGGVDQYKANHWRPIQDMLAKGFAFATLDLPGFGESRQWGRDVKAEANFAVLDSYMKRSDLETTRVSFFGQSYGGAATLRAALRNDTRVKAIVAMCAGLHLGEKNSLAPDAKPGDKLINGPMLVVNGTRDAGNPVPDLMSTYQSVKDGDLWLLGRGEHCAVEYWPVVIPQMADWLKEKINR
jgi:dienelactone hydrolase